METIVECMICSEHYDSSQHLPLVLTCGHTICSSCAEQLISRKTYITCPIDRINDERPIKKISHSYHILELVEQISSMSQKIKLLKLSPQERLETMKQQVKDNLQNYNDRLEQVAEKIREVKLKQEGVLQEIEEDFGLAFEILQQRKKQLESEVNEVAGNYLQEYKLIEEETQKAKEHAEKELKALEETHDVQEMTVSPVTNLSSLPEAEVRFKLIFDKENTVKFLGSLGKIGNWRQKVPFECDNFKNVTYWMVPPCCYKYYCCNKCHDAKESHPWSYANRMVCMVCEKEQDYRKLPNSCEKCDTYHRGVVSKSV